MKNETVLIKENDINCIPKVSVIVPVYNVQDYLKECLDSIIKQTLNEIEIICVDDGSTDSSLEILKEYANKDKRIKILAQQNSGASKARNNGLNNANGEYVCFIDGDDWLDEKFCETLYSKALTINADISKGVLNRQLPSKWSKSELNKEISQDRFKFVKEFTTAIFKRNFLLENNIFFPDNVLTGEDYVFIIKSILACKNLAIENSVCYNYRRTPNSKSKTLNDKKLESLLTNIEIIGKTINQYELPQKKYQEIIIEFLQAQIIRRANAANLPYKKINGIIKKAYKTLKPTLKYPIEEKLINYSYKDYCYSKKIMHYSLIENIFSIKKNLDKTHRVLSFLGIKIKFKIKDKKAKNIHNKKNAQKNNDEIICLLSENIEKINKKLDLQAKSLKLLETKIHHNIINNIPRMISINKLHSEVFPKYKNINQGKDVVLVATGPTLQKFIPIENAIYVGVNRAYQYDKVNFDYLFLQDYAHPTKDFIEEFMQYRPEHTKKFIGYVSYSNLRTSIIPEKYSYYPNVERYYTMEKTMRYHFTFDISSEPFAEAGTVALPAMQFILWTRPKRIYIVGCDCSHQGYFKQNQGVNKLNIDGVIDGWKRLKEFIDAYYPDVEVISVNPEGLKGIFTDYYQA